MEKKDRFPIIDSLRSKYRLTWLLQIASVSKAGYYKWKKARERVKQRAIKEQELQQHILAIHRVRPYYGYYRVAKALRKEGIIVNHKRVYRMMKDLQIQSTIRKKRKYFGRKPSVLFPNRLDRKFRADARNQKWVTDITYLPFRDGFVYLSVIQDLFNNEIISYHVSTKNDLHLVLETLQKACKDKDLTGTLIHSDQGFQYTSKQYHQKLLEAGLLGSHSRRGNCLDNAAMESFFSHLKSEMPNTQLFHTLEELIHSVDEYITFYNYERFQKKLGDRSPIEYRIAIAA